MRKIIASSVLNVLLILSMFFTVYTNYGGIEKYGVGYILSMGFPFAVLLILTSVVSIVFIIVTIIKNISAKRRSVIAWLPVALFIAPVIADVILRIVFTGKL